MKRHKFPILMLLAWAASAAPATPPAPSVPTSYADEPACEVKSVRRASSSYENMFVNPASGLVAATQPDAHAVYQVYVGQAGTSNLRCITCTAQSGAPAVNRNKPMISWHPSGQWLVVGVEEASHDLSWVSHNWQRGLLQSGIWLNIWVTTPNGDRWFQLTDFKKQNGPANGFSGVAFTPDGRHGVWAEIVDGNVFANAFGIWKLYIADFTLGLDGHPTLAHKRDITPPGAKWVEPGNFGPDGRHLLISSDIGLADAQGQDQWLLDVVSGQLRNLTNSPTVWDEHGLFSPDGRKISFMSSYPYRNNPHASKAASLQTEIMLMNSDGSHLQQITHFNSSGYPESQPGLTVAAVGEFMGDGSEMFVTVMSRDYKFGKSNWTVEFKGRCGNQGRH